MDSKCVVNGAVGGFLAGAALIVLFFFYDLARGVPLATPTFLASAVFGNEGPLEVPAQVAIYTVAHFIVLTLLGIVAALLIEAARLPRNLLVGTAYGLFACTLVFYAALISSGAAVLDAPAWPIVFVGNVMAGAIIVTYLRLTGPEQGFTGLMHHLSRNQVIREGVVAGLIGAAVVALWFLVLDSVSGRPLFTPGALGSAIFFGTASVDNVTITPSTVIGYSLFHLAAFLFVGVVASALVTQAEKFPPLVFGLIIFFVVFETFIVSMTALLGAWLMQELAWWSVLVGNFLAAASMGMYLWHVHPKLRELLNDEVLWAEP
jgi:hypothetical protein